ncbi:hypothetical protein [Photobacterium chitinilyticum]|uniref:Uncharacterized protein n=1 Tax=Photobacterium chitinilyticum TaxID=2485123 RepID=A0A444JKL1_9GAMM|nr:hypothetical protein [Photobacterium chitinilyticum]RWX53590.1 hypothetical protein EDI28_21350 [Photobacterium chitinilyticum]
MAKSLCKYRRVEIADQFATISKIVSEPKFVCSSCARSASNKDYLCKPSALARTRTLAAISTATSEATQKMPPVSELPMPSSVAQTQLAAIAVVEQEEAVVLPTVTKKQVKQLKMLAKKKNKRLKKAAKAVQRYDKALQKAKKALQL